MKSRILYGWNIRRVLYSMMGLAVIISAVTDHQWVLSLFGAYFLGMGVFGFGCAGAIGCAIDARQHTRIEEK